MTTLAEGLKEVVALESQFSTKPVALTANDFNANGRIGVTINGQQYDDKELLTSLCKTLRYPGLAKDLSRLPAKETRDLLKSVITAPVNLQVIYRGLLPVAFRRHTEPTKVSQVIQEITQGNEQTWNSHFVKDWNTTLESRITDTTRSFKMSSTDEWNCGISINRNYSRQSEYDIRAMLYRLVCSNGAIAVRCTYRLNTAREDNLHSAIERLAGSLDPIWTRMQTEVVNTSKASIKNTKDRFEGIAKLMHLSKDHKDEIKSSLSDNMNFYDFHNVLTQFAQKMPLNSRRGVETKVSQMIQQVSGGQKLPFYRALFV